MIKLLIGMGFQGRLAFQTSVFLSLFCLQTAYSQSFLAGYQFRKLLTVDGSFIAGAGAINDFPIFLDITDTDLRDEARSDGFDIAFADTDGTTQFDHELFDYDNSSGRL